MNGNISGNICHKKLYLFSPFFWRTGSQMLGDNGKEIKLLFKFLFGHEWKDISTRSVTKSCPCFSFWAEKVFVWSWSVVGGQQCSAAATNRNDRGQSPPTDRPKWLLLVNRRKSNEAFPFSRDILIVLGNTNSSFSSLNLWAHCWGICGQNWGRRLKNTWHAQVSLERPQLDCLCQINRREKCQTLNLAVMAQTEQLKFEKETAMQNEQHQMCKVLLQKVMSEMQRFVPNRSACKYMH